MLVKLIANIFIYDNLEFNNRNDCWPKQTLNEIPLLQKVMPKFVRI